MRYLFNSNDTFFELGNTWGKKFKQLIEYVKLIPQHNPLLWN